MTGRLLRWRQFYLAPQFRQQFLQLTIIVAVLTIVSILAFRASVPQMLYALALVVGTSSAVVLLKWPAFGLILILISGFFLPTFGPGRLNATVVLMTALSGLWLWDMVAKKKLGQLLWVPVTQAMVAFVTVSLLAFVAGQLPWHALAGRAPLDAQLAGLAIYLLSAAAFFMASTQLRTVRWLKGMVFVFIAVSAAFLLFRNVPPLKPLARVLFPERGAGGGVFWAWFPALTLSQALFNRALHLRWRLLLGGLTAGSLAIAIGFNYQWKAVWVTAVVTVGLIVAWRSWRLALAVGVVGLLLTTLLMSDLLSSDAYSVSTRLEAWSILAQIIKASPILGLGFANYYWITPLYPIRGWYVSFNSHNTYVDIIAQTGLIGLVCFGWFMWAIARLAWRLARDAESDFERAYAYGALAGLAGTLFAAMLGDWLLGFVYNVGLGSLKSAVIAWLVLGGLVSLHSNRQVNRLPT